MKLPESEDEKKMRGSHRHEIKDRTLDCGYIKKSTKKNGKLYMEHSTKGNSKYVFRFVFALNKIFCKIIS